MKNILMIVMLTLSVFIQGCARGIWETWPRANTDELGGYEKNYQLGVKKSAFIGQEIINIKKYNTTILAAQSSDSATITTKYNTSTVKYFIDKDKIYFLPESIRFNEKYYLLSNGDWSLLISEDGSISNKFIYSVPHKLVYTPFSKISIVPKDIKLSFTRTYSKPLFSYQLIYSGINDVLLNINYREYTGNDLARPAFIQNLTYNIDAKQIRYKDFLIQIHNVTNENITYTVLEDGLK